MEWCITHHIRAQYIETTLQYTEMKYSICSLYKVERVLEAVSGFTNPAKPGIAKDLIEADVIAGRLLQTSLTHF